MEISEEQKAAIVGWISEGKTLAELQKLLREEFSLPMTYMDVRFLVDDLGIEFTEPAEEETPASGDEKAPEAAVDDAPEKQDGAGGSVRVDVDAVTRPGSLVSGTVVSPASGGLPTALVPPGP